MTFTSKTTVQLLMLASALLASAGSTFAATPSATASNTSRLSYTLVDLDPNDNVSASLTFSGSFDASISSNNATSYTNYSSDQTLQVPPGQDSSTSRSISFPETTATAHSSITFAGGAWPDTFSSSASATFLTSTPVANNFDTQAQGFTMLFGSYVLSAHTQVIWDLQIQNSATTVATPNHLGNSAGAYGQLVVSADPARSIYEYGASALDSINGVTTPSFHHLSNNQGFADILSLTTDLVSLAQYNNTSGDLTAYLYVSTSSGLLASQPLSAVPEPGSCALMLAGLGALGMTGRRRGGARPGRARCAATTG